MKTRPSRGATVAGLPESLAQVVAYDFTGPRTLAMNEAIFHSLQTEAHVVSPPHGENIREQRATRCVFDMEPLPVGLRLFRPRLYEALRDYRARWRPDLVGVALGHRSWVNHYGPDQGIPWHAHGRSQVVAVYVLRGTERSDLIVEDPQTPGVCFRVGMPTGRLLFMSGNIWHCASPNFSATTRAVLAVNFYPSSEAVPPPA